MRYSKKMLSVNSISRSPCFELNKAFTKERFQSYGYLRYKIYLLYLIWKADLCLHTDHEVYETTWIFIYASFVCLSSPIIRTTLWIVVWKRTQQWKDQFLFAMVSLSGCSWWFSADQHHSFGLKCSPSLFMLHRSVKIWHVWCLFCLSLTQPFFFCSSHTTTVGWAGSVGTGLLVHT